MVKKKMARSPSRSMRKQAFVRELLSDPKRNARQAAVRAGYSPASAHNMAHRLMRDREVVEALEKHVAKINARYEITSENITRELARIAYANPLDFGYVDEHGQFKVDLTNTDRDQFAGVSEIKTRTIRHSSGRGRGRPPKGVVVPPPVTETMIRLSEKRAALVDLGKITGLFKDGPDITVPISFVVERTGRSKG